MPLPKNHPDYDYLQEKLDELRKRISEKKANAQKLFEQLLQYLNAGMGVSVPDGLKEELESIKNMLSEAEKGTAATSPQQEQEEEIDVTSAELTTEDILKAINSMLSANSKGVKDEVKVLIHTKKLREELRNIIAARTATEAALLPQQLRNIAQASDFIDLLNSPDIQPLTAASGGAEKVLDHAMTVAESRLSLFDKIADLGEKIGGSVSPEDTPGHSQATDNIKQR